MGVFDEHFPEIGEEERKIFLSHTWVKPQLGVHFAGFDSERDTKYVRALNSLVENSDLNLVIKRFSGDRNDEKKE